MGNVIATNAVDSMINSTATAMNGVMSSCTTRIQNTAGVSISGNTGSSIRVGEINVNQYAKVDTHCTTDARTSTKIDSSVEQTIQQTAEAISQNLSLNPGSTAANNFLRLSNNLMSAIENTFHQECVQEFNNTATFNIDDNKNSQIEVGIINLNQTAEGFAKCIQKADAVNDIKQQMIQSLSQEASAKQENSLGALFLILLMIFLIIFIIIIGSFKLIIMLCILAVVLAAIYVGVSAAFNMPPFAKSEVPGVSVALKIMDIPVTEGVMTFTTGSTVEFTAVLDGDNADSINDVQIYSNGASQGSMSDEGGNDFVFRRILNIPGTYNYKAVVFGVNTSEESLVQQVDIVPGPSFIIQTVHGGVSQDWSTTTRVIADVPPAGVIITVKGILVPYSGSGTSDITTFSRVRLFNGDQDLGVMTQGGTTAEPFWTKDVRVTAPGNYNFVVKGTNTNDRRIGTSQIQQVLAVAPDETAPEIFT